MFMTIYYFQKIPWNIIKQNLKFFFSGAKTSNNVFVYTIYVVRKKYNFYLLHFRDIFAFIFTKYALYF